MKILLIGANGLLGRELQKQNSQLLCPPKSQLNILSADEVSEYINAHKPELVINAAAILDNRVLDKQPEIAIATNIIGAANVAIACIEANIRLVYISTDYIYKGDRGNYLETDEILPFNFYSWTKLGGECSVKGVKNHLIIRTSFGPSDFAYSEAFTDKWASKDYVDVVAPMIYEAALSPLTGILNVGTDRKTLYDYASRRNTVKPVKLSETNFFTPYDTSLNLQKWLNYKSAKPTAKPHVNCRVCGSDKLSKYLDLGLMPLANNLEVTSLRAKDKERYPLQVMFCESCGLSQLSVVIDPEEMFSYYTYRSSINGGYVKHCRTMAKSLQDKYKLTPESFHIDVAGNDGALLKEFKDEIGLKVLNVDPASNLVAIAEQQGIESLADFWSVELSGKIVDKYGKADLITATNVFAHVDNVTDFVLAAKNTLKDEGVLVLEFPYLIDFIENIEFDTVYFEHLSYFSILPINHLCALTGMKIISVEKQNIHGGTVRVTIANQNSHRTVENSVFEYVDSENKSGFSEFKKYSAWAKQVKKSIDSFASNIVRLKKEGNKIAAFAASAKGNTLLNSAMINTDIFSYIADETPEKVGKFSPGTGIPIVNKQEIIKNPPDYLVILSWNFSDEIISKVSKFYKGKYIIPIPEFTIL